MDHTHVMHACVDNSMAFIDIIIVPLDIEPEHGPNSPYSPRGEGGYLNWLDWFACTVVIIRDTPRS